MLDLTQRFIEKGEKIVFLGDSLTYADPGYVSLLQERLPDNPIINSGVGGDKTTTALMRFKPDVLEHKPDVLSIFFGVNDSAIGRGKWADEPMLPPEAFRTNLIWMVHIARLHGIKKVSIAIPFDAFEGPVFFEQGNILGQYCIAAREAAAMMKTCYVPLDAVFLEEWQKHPGHTDSGLLLTRDGCHPTMDGNRLIADSFMKAWNLTNG